MTPKWIVLLCVILLCGCTRYERSEEPEISPEILVFTQEENKPEQEERIPVKVKGVYISAYVAGNETMMNQIIDQIDQTEINAVVIDVKDDEGRITFAMDSPVVTELGAVDVKIPDMPALMAKLKEHGIYTIARVVAFRDPYLAEVRPELSLKQKDGSIYRDRKGLAWLNPYKAEIWEYLMEVGTEAHKAGFDEIQLDYIRFSTEKGMEQVVYEETDTNGRSKTEIITEFVDYACKNLTEQGAFVSADVFGVVMGGGEDSDTVGQSYGAMAKHLDTICPMVYPSHYGVGNFGIEHPDTRPYDTITGAMKQSKKALDSYKTEGEHQAAVRPWLQDFTASYLDDYIPYGEEEVRSQIQAVYDSGYEEWILWNAASKYHWGGLEPTENEGSTETLPENGTAAE